MAKKPAAIYEPGELDRVRRNLGDMDRDEAKRIAALLGGEIGVERTETPKPVKRRSSRDETVTVSVRGRSAASTGRRVEVLDTEPERRSRRGRPKDADVAADTSDDPSTAVKPSYRERVKIDRYMAQSEFEIKNSGQIFYSMISLFGEPPDQVNPGFVTKRMNEYYSRLELLVTSTRTMLPRNNVPRAEELRKKSPFAFKILDTIRQWNLERIAAELARIQSKPREVVVEDFADILRLLYRTIYILEDLDPESHVRDAYKCLYDQLLAESVIEAKERHHGQFRAALSSYVYVMRSVRYLLYPLLLKLLSDRWLAYDAFFLARRRRFESFIDAKASDKIRPPATEQETVSAAEQAKEPESEPTEVPNADAQPPEPRDAFAASDGVDSIEVETAVSETTDSSPHTSPSDSGGDTSGDTGGDGARSTQERTPSSRAWMRGMEVLEGIFPEAGWNDLPSWPDLYPYFIGVFDLKKGFELVPPNDPLQQVVILMHVIEELFYGMRFVEFGTISTPAGEHERVDEAMGRIVDGWHGYLEEAIGKEYLPRLSEYCRLADSSPESRTSNYAKRTLTELLWMKRLNFLPFLRFESAVSSHPFRKQDELPFYAVVRELRRLLTGVAAGIEAGNKRGGPAANAVCDGIDNPWAPYVFQIPNPVSRRIDALLGGRNSKRRNNAALVFFTLSAATVLDSLINDKGSYAYYDEAGCPFRSVGGEGLKPVFGVDEKIDADAVFKRVIKSRANREP